MENSKLVEIVKPYFDSNEELQSLFVTDDGNVFYKEAKSFMTAHCIQAKTKENYITRKIYNDMVKELNAPKKAQTKVLPKKDEPEIKAEDNK